MLRNAIILLILVSFLLGCASVEGLTPVGVQENCCDKNLSQAIADLPPWRADRNFVSEERLEYIGVAKRLQSVSSEVQASAYQEATEIVRARQMAEPVNSSSFSRFYILNRILFDVPDSVSKSDYVPHCAWLNIMSSYSENGETVNPSWPVLWKGNGDFALLDFYEGVRGVYIPIREHKYLGELFDYRDLD